MTKKNDIFVPEGYFQNLEQKLSRIPRQEVRPTTLQKVSPWIAYAASLVILASVGGFIFRKAAEPVLQEEYSERLYWHVRRMVASHEDADDLLQEIFLKIWIYPVPWIRTVCSSKWRPQT